MTDAEHHDHEPVGVALLGSTGSIGLQTLDVLAEHTNRFRVHSLAANRNVEALADQVARYAPTRVVIGDRDAFERGKSLFGSTTDVRFGPEELEQAAADLDAPIVVNALVGFAGLRPTLAAADAGKHIALANKETLVVAGRLVAQAAKAGGASIVPVDSEHSALQQAIVGESPSSIDRMILTASGGPFRTRPIEEFASITRAEALRHPNWTMGAKITIDSATMMNKGLEIIEAARLFDLPAKQLEVVVHPESIIHSMVRFIDGSIKAQLSLPDMRMPIRYALGFPERLHGSFEPLDLAAIGSLTFERPDVVRFPALRLAYEVLEADGTAPTVLNAANEIAVAAFLEERIDFLAIPALVERALEESENVADPDLATIFDVDKRTRIAIRSYVEQIAA